MRNKAVTRIPTGSIVLSKRGHDKGNLFIVTDVSDDGYVMLVDGMTRKVQKPKRKKVIHIELTTLQSTDITDLTNKIAAATVKSCKREYSRMDTDSSDSSELPKG